MKALLSRLDWLRVAVLLLFAAPLAALVWFGFWWLWQNGYFLVWLLVLTSFAALGYALQWFLARRQRRLLEDVATEPAPHWPPRADAVWQRINAFADTLDPVDWPLDDAQKLLELARMTLQTVARAYHPKARQPLLELTVPHTLLIIERASRDLRQDIVEHVPFSHRLSIGDMRRAQHWKRSAEKAFHMYRAGRMVVNPVDAVVSEAWRYVRERGLGSAGEEIQRWLLRAYVRKLGYYAIDLYSGQLPLDDKIAATASTPESDEAVTQAETEHKEQEAEPLRIVIAGRSNAGKSSLINALFGQLTAAPDVLADTTQAVTPYRLEREGLTRALVFDTPGCDGGRGSPDTLVKLAREADMILWVSPVHRPDRERERDCLEAVRNSVARTLDRRPPALLVVASHIDRLPPLRQWQPPYDLARADTPKAANIRDAVTALARDLDVDPQAVIPVCLGEGRVYNVEDGLWAAMLTQQSSALQSRLLRCLRSRRKQEDWTLLRRQLVGAGRMVGKWWWDQR